CAGSATPKAELARIVKVPPLCPAAADAELELELDGEPELHPARIRVSAPRAAAAANHPDRWRNRGRRRDAGWTGAECTTVPDSFMFGLLAVGSHRSQEQTISRRSQRGNALTRNQRGAQIADEEAVNPDRSGP